MTYSMEIVVRCFSGSVLEILDRTGTCVVNLIDKIFNQVIADEYMPIYWQCFTKNYKNNLYLRHSVLRNYFNIACYFPNSLYFKSSARLKNWVLYTVAPHIVCNYFEKQTYFDCFWQQQRYETKLNDLFNNCFKFNEFIEGSFHSKYRLYRERQNLILLTRAHSACLVLQEKYNLSADVCYFITSFVADQIK
jgi:hypothetical protein